MHCYDKPDPFDHSSRSPRNWAVIDVGFDGKRASLQPAPGRPIMRDSPGIYRSGTFVYDMNHFGYQASDPTSRYGGSPGDVSVVGDWNGDGFAEPGIYRIVDGRGTFFL